MAVRRRRREGWDQSIDATTREVVRVALPTEHGVFEARAFECGSGFVYLALLLGDIGDGYGVLTRLHSECLTGDALGSVRCDCGVQLRQALRIVAAEGRGVVVYATGHEGRGIGLVNKLRAYLEQDHGADTVDANLRLGLAVDSRDYGDAAQVLRSLGIRSVRLLTNNPDKVEGLKLAGLPVENVQTLATAPHTRNLGYLRTKKRRLAHTHLTGQELPVIDPRPPDASGLLGSVTRRLDRPYVVVKYAQTLDGRIATRTGDSKWISGESERRVSHALRASCDAVLVGVGTVLSDDPQLTVRMVPGISPRRVILDSTLRIPLSARILEDDAPTTVITTDRSSPADRRALRRRHVGIEVVPAGPGGVSLPTALAALHASGVICLLVEGGAGVITSMLRGALVDRIVVSLSGTIIGAGTEAVGNLDVDRVDAGIRLSNRCIHATDEDLVVAWDVDALGLSRPLPAVAAAEAVNA
jgi:GTP cyclohydrolase II